MTLRSTWRALVPAGLLPAALVAAGAFFSGWAGATDAGLLRQTRHGAVLGLAEPATGTQAWLGVPFAKPPVGTLRWRPPAEPEAWAGTRLARDFGASCAQIGRYFSPAPNNAPYGLSVRDGMGQPVGAEDCLTLNIWRPAATPAAAGARLPVMVFIHGGSNISGYSADPIYHGAALAARTNAVVVTVNYRLGLLGWFDLGQLKTGDPVADSGNFALLDQIRALQFIQQNIEAFGGDAGNVTVMGESAGAVNTWALMVSPLTGGLFHKAVSMSGGIQTATPLTARAYAKNLLNALLVADGKAANALGAEWYVATHAAAHIADYLRSKPANEILRVAHANATLGNAPAVLTDGAVIPWNPNLAIALGAYRRVPMLAGTTREEAKLFGGLVGAYKPSEYDRFTLQYQFDPDAPPTLTESDLLNPLYLPVDRPGGWNDVAAVLTHAVFTQAMLSSMGTLATKQSAQMWQFRFDWKQQPVPFDTVYGAAHAMDLPFWFGNFGPSVFSFSYSQANRPGRLALSNVMMDTLGAFAATGDPNHPGLGRHWPNWPAVLTLDASRTAVRIGTP